MTDADARETTPPAPAPARSATDSDEPAYQVLARKYRPQTFAELVGQDALVRTLTNAIERDRIAHAFIFTGVRGIGKTTTARIVARALNCVGPDGTGGPTVTPCGECEFCVAIAADRHVDVIEMDAASHTGVDNIRELIESARYRPVTARYKVYIIDEVHMLSKAAFNALLKTLEEPPEHVKFIFATTEIRKVPITVLSRCQRFDLRRLDHETMAAHLGKVASSEGAGIEPAALALLARAADGSARDGLSLLDQAIAHGAAAGSATTAEQVRDMLGLADRALVLDLFELVMKGDIRPALDLAGELYRSGADPIVVVQDLLDLVHWLTRLRIVPEAAAGQALSDAEHDRAAAMARALAMPVLSRAWQMLLKGLYEVQSAHAPMPALEMALVRLAYAAELPAPAAILESLEKETGDTATPEPAQAKVAPSQPRAPEPELKPESRAGAGPESGHDSSPPQATASAGVSVGATGGSAQPQAAQALRPEAAAAPEPNEPEPPVVTAIAPETEDPGETPPSPQSFEEVVDLFKARREGILTAHLVRQVHLVRFAPGEIEFRPADGAPENLAARIGALLSEWTGEHWRVAASREPGEPTLAEQADAAERERRDKAAADPRVRAVLDTFPGAEIEAVRDLDASEANADDRPDGDNERDPREHDPGEGT